MKRLKLLLGLAIATTLLFTACDKDKMYEKKIVGEWVPVNPNSVGNPEASYIANAFNTFCSYVSIKENGYWSCAMGIGYNTDDIHDTLSISTSTDWENHSSWIINDEKLSIDLVDNGTFVYNFNIEYITEE
jgi:hypothetical protein